MDERFGRSQVNGLVMGEIGHEWSVLLRVKCLVLDEWVGII